MGSSYRQDLNSGMCPKWEKNLRDACTLIQGVIDDLYEVTGSDGQFDNAADDGALRQQLYLAKRFILEELPKIKE